MPSVTKALHVHPAIPSNLTPNQAFDSNTGILRALLSDVLTLTFKYWITTRSILTTFTQDCQEAGYEVLYLTPFLTKAAWTRLYPIQPVSNTISARLTETDTPNFPSLASSVPTMPTPETPTSHNSSSNAHVDPTTALIALMHQTLQQNATRMSHMQTRTYPLSVQQTPTTPTYKPHFPSPFQNGTGRHGLPLYSSHKLQRTSPKTFTPESTTGQKKHKRAGTSKLQSAPTCCYCSLEQSL